MPLYELTYRLSYVSSDHRIDTRYIISEYQDICKTGSGNTGEWFQEPANNDGNGRMSRLLTTLLLYRSGFYVGRYISLEAKIAKNKDLYYAALGASRHGWHEGLDDPVPFIKYLLGTILAAYKDFADRFALVENKLSALETVRLASQNKIGRFTKQDIRELCPALSLSSVEGALRKMVADGELKREGRGKNTCYIRLL